MIDVLPTPARSASLGSNACPTVALTPQTVRAAFTKEETCSPRLGVRYLDPLLNLEDRRPVRAADARDLGPAARASRASENERALEAGFAALGALRSADPARARARRSTRSSATTASASSCSGRPYHHDPGLNHGIAEELQKLGLPGLLAEHAAARRRPARSAVRRRGAGRGHRASARHLATSGRTRSRRAAT